ncbi:tRNA modification GTPase TrmE [Dichomitus squalens LYAD-421 SS1]|uniref:tRNA modification GTPase TrmE n=1 Tax=Dichomitus squalens (strain LYAD-421) TaxID=732165 RepID=UPI00044125B5|nr:tRNA modification GTPase TrmE [Dichomitus squalens LYAD-421 SS1]EJF63061.1 tRNA modification GTPase TrmE [Dichomitus squalens LYAD-421 SS1]
MHGRTFLRTRTVCSLEALIHFAEKPSYRLPRCTITTNGNRYRIAGPRSHHFALRCGLLRLYSTSSSTSNASAGYSWVPANSRSDRDPPELVLSDAQRRTIYALSTPPGKAGVAVIRISGPDALKVWSGMVRTRAAGKGKAREREPEPWRMHRCSVVHPGSSEVLDDGLAVFFQGPKSFTTEDVLELHVHSGRAIISSVLNAISFFPFCRPAERGEFTRRAFEGGRLDLTQVEGLRDLIDAETESQRKLALKTAGGATRARLEELRNEIIQCLALVEALIDFGEGEDIEEGVFDQARIRVLKLRDTIQHHLSDNRRGEIMRSGIRLAIFGPPNAGKSSLLNFLAQREAAIVTPIPGTTRDILELSLDISGLPVIIADTAGLRKTDDIVEQIGVERAKQLVQSADVSLCVLSAPEVVVSSAASGTPLNIPPTVVPLMKDDTIVLLNKVDLLPSSLSLPSAPAQATWGVSLSTGQGTQTFLEQFGEILITSFRYHILRDSGVSAEEPLITHARHRCHLENALKFLEAFLNTPPEEVVFAAEELRYAAQAIGKISGLIDVEDILDAVFRDFCIGK